MAVIDVITYNGEVELFNIRYNILKDYVDEFIVVEFDKTFSGKSKPWYFEQIKDKYEKIRFYPTKEEEYKKYYEEASKSPSTEYGRGADHWKTEFMQKESIKKALTHLNDDDIVFIGDCDEIWDPEIVKNRAKYKVTKPLRLKLLVYTYFLNNRSSEEFWGTLVSYWDWIKDKSLNHLRSNTILKTTHGGYGGWHFTSLKDGLRRKLEDSYTKETYANDWVMGHLEENVKNNKDFLGRDFRYWVDESEWPQYLKDNKKKYAYLCK